MTTTDVDNWPGDHDGLQGPALMERMEKHALKYNVDITFDHINEVTSKIALSFLKAIVENILLTQ